MLLVAWHWGLRLLLPSMQHLLQPLACLMLTQKGTEHQLVHVLLAWVAAQATDCSHCHCSVWHVDVAVCAGPEDSAGLDASADHTGASTVRDVLAAVLAMLCHVTPACAGVVAAVAHGLAAGAALAALDAAGMVVVATTVAVGGSPAAAAAAAAAASTAGHAVERAGSTAAVYAAAETASDAEAVAVTLLS